MLKQRIAETTQGIEGEITVSVYDRFSRNMRDKGWIDLDNVLKSGIKNGNVLEIGPGPGYLGLEWLKRSPGSELTGCEISKDMIKLAAKNAKDYGLETKACYVEGNSMHMPFGDETFDGVFTNGSMHEWEEPIKVFDEIYRVLKSGGLYCITDLRRDVNPFVKRLIYFTTQPKEIRPGLITSLNSSYTVSEIKEITDNSALKMCKIEKEFFGLCISGKKQQ